MDLSAIFLICFPIEKVMTQPTLETERLIIREIVHEDLEGMFELDSSPLVHKYLGKKPIKTKAETIKIIDSIRQQYQNHGIGRWGVEEKSTGKFVGWTGFKKNTEDEINGMKDVLDLGYRFIESAWGKGYATETCIACLDYGFDVLKFDPIYGAAELANGASNHILKKLGMEYTNDFVFDNEPHHFYELTKAKWQQYKHRL